MVQVVEDQALGQMPDLPKYLLDLQKLTTKVLANHLGRVALGGKSTSIAGPVNMMLGKRDNSSRAFAI